MTEKKDLLKEGIEILKIQNVNEWYTKTMLSKSQYYTIDSLEQGVRDKEISLREALFIALIVGVQWHEKFDGF